MSPFNKFKRSCLVMVVDKIEHQKRIKSAKEKEVGYIYTYLEIGK